MDSCGRDHHTRNKKAWGDSRSLEMLVSVKEIWRSSIIFETLHVPSMTNQEHQSIRKQLVGVSTNRGQTIDVTLPQRDNNMNADAEEEGVVVLMIHPLGQQLGRNGSW